MADTYAEAAIAAGNVARAMNSTGRKMRRRVVTFETAAAYAAGEIKRLFTVGAHEVPTSIKIVNDAIAGATDVEIGLWRVNSGLVIDQDCFLGSLDIAAGFAWGSEKDGLTALAIEHRGIRSFQEHAAAVSTDPLDDIGHIPNDSYDVGMIFNSDVSAVGTVTVEMITVDKQ